MKIWKTYVRPALLGGAAMVATTGALAAPQDYEFRLLASDVKQSSDASVSVRLIHKPSGRAVPDAVIYATRLDMTPDGMPTMTTPVTAVPGGEPGIYRFRTNLVMAGGWQLTITAKVQGDEGTVQQRLVLRAVP